MNRFDANSTTDQVIDGISLQGQLAVVTGASSGLGVETCRVLAAAGATVLMVARDEEKLESVAQELRRQQPDAQLHTQIMDLADLNSVRIAATEILLHHGQIQLLINNAGCSTRRRALKCSLVQIIWGIFCLPDYCLMHLSMARRGGWST